MYYITILQLFLKHSLGQALHVPSRPFTFLHIPSHSFTSLHATLSRSLTSFPSPGPFTSSQHVPPPPTIIALHAQCGRKTYPDSLVQRSSVSFAAQCNWIHSCLTERSVHFSLTALLNGYRTYRGDENRAILLHLKLCLFSTALFVIDAQQVTSAKCVNSHMHLKALSILIDKVDRGHVFCFVNFTEVSSRQTRKNQTAWEVSFRRTGNVTLLSSSGVAQ